MGKRVNFRSVAKRLLAEGWSADKLESYPASAANWAMDDAYEAERLAVGNPMSDHDLPKARKRFSVLSVKQQDRLLVLVRELENL